MLHSAPRPWQAPPGQFPPSDVPVCLQTESRRLWLAQESIPAQAWCSPSWPLSPELQAMGGGAWGMWGEEARMSGGTGGREVSVSLSAFLHVVNRFPLGIIYGTLSVIYISVHLLIRCLTDISVNTLWGGDHCLFMGICVYTCANACVCLYLRTGYVYTHEHTCVPCVCPCVQDGAFLFLNLKSWAQGPICWRMMA